VITLLALKLTALQWLSGTGMLHTHNSASETCAPAYFRMYWVGSMCQCSCHAAAVISYCPTSQKGIVLLSGVAFRGGGGICFAHTHVDIVACTQYELPRFSSVACCLVGKLSVRCCCRRWVLSVFFCCLALLSRPSSAC
jgi:hypothetical protein